MRSLTLTQPWAGLVAASVKLVENRPRRMIKRENFSQRFAIHASREIDLDVYDRILELAPELYAGDDAEEDRPWWRLTRITGAVIGVATLDSVIDNGGCNGAEMIEMDQRRWFFGPIGYVLRDVRALPEPVPCRGMLGFWTLPDDVAARVEAQLR